MAYDDCRHWNNALSGSDTRLRRIAARDGTQQGQRAKPGTAVGCHEPRGVSDRHHTECGQDCRQLTKGSYFDSLPSGLHAGQLRQMEIGFTVQGAL